MGWQWIEEKPAYWDPAKENVIGGAPSGSFPPMTQAPGDVLPGEWWRAEEDGAVVGYGWMDETWGEALILLAVAPEAKRRGLGSFILDRLETAAAKRGFRYMYNVVPPGHPEGAAVRRWLEKRGFKASEDGRQLRRTIPGPAPDA